MVHTVHKVHRVLRVSRTLVDLCQDAIVLVDGNAL
jgi:predicted ATPase with chaperone activity